MVIPITTQEIEEEIRMKEAEAESQWKRTQAETLQIKKKIQGSHQETGTNKRKSAALLWVLFGDVCPLYDKIYMLWRLLNHPSIKAVKSIFTRFRCTYITWQVFWRKQDCFPVSGWDPMILQIRDQEYPPQLI